MILAHLLESEREHLFETVLPKLTDKTILESSALREDCLRIRDIGYAVSQGERQTGAGSVAAPLFDLDGEVVGAISICGPTNRLTVDVLRSMSETLLRHAHEISEGLGYDPRDFEHAA